ncbi:peptidoglycan-recognition protein LF isoform X1 [Papilio machaon]|uniref:peptidoglycan-recognition protein LF isoform X1 n=1 Tax=Papilio machaon TaxID=76193 RepID=UPI001E663ECF|nr:peptidoglycan-recognition protein LF isoform X1 [Papilio machaon]
MWTAKDDQPSDALGRTSTNSDVVLVDGQGLAPASTPPTIANLNVTKSSRVHIGPKFVSVTQNLQNTEVVKGRLLGLELVSPKGARRLRCSVAVFVCWAFLVASGLVIYLVAVALPRPQGRLDIDMPFPVYVWHIIKNSSRAERLSCLAALLVLFVCIGLIVYFTVLAKNTTDDITDVAPHEWNISREMWLAQPYENNGTTKLFDPLKLVVIQHTVSPRCERFILCAAELRNMQAWFISQYHYDIPYNFIIGNDGRVYEGRGWGIEGAHTLGYNRCSLGLGFIGDYREELPVHSRVTDLQIKRAKMILEEGVKLGYLAEDYVVLGAKDLHLTASPGSNLYNAIRKWDHYGHVNLWRNSTCEEMHGLPPRQQLIG